MPASRPMRRSNLLLIAVEGVEEALHFRRKWSEGGVLAQKKAQVMSVIVCPQQLTALCDTCEPCTFTPRNCHFIGAELARLPETG